MYVCSECGLPAPAAGPCAADGTPLAPIGEDILLGTTIGVYRVARLLGIGGMGRVYKGAHPAIGSRVAIKVLSRECSDRRDLVERFFAEAKAVNVIRHESIVNVLDLAMLPDGRPYIIMEYLDGAPLAAIIEHAVQTQRPLPLGGLARLAAEVLDALAAAHAKGIVHRDLKPDNIFVAPSGRPKVLDFGIAKLSDLGTGGSATRTGSLLGTPHYMSPEQAAGKPVDHRSDIYAMGVILFECATGRKPFVGESLFELLRNHVEAPPPAPSALRPDLGPALESVILTALAKPVDQRFSSAQAMSAALQHATAQLGPEQWTPITSGTISGSGPAPSGWQGTPPAGWGTGRTGAPTHPSAQTAPTTGGGSRPPGALALQSTVNASTGQIQPPAPARSRKGLWIGLGAVALAGGGIAFAVANSGGETGTTATPAEETPRPAPTDRAEPEKEKDADEPPDTDLLDPDLSGDPSKALESALKQLESLDGAGLPPATRKQLEALKGLSKLPPKERAAKLKELSKTMNLPDLGDAFDALDTGSAARVKPEADADDPPAPPTPAPPPKPPAGSGAGVQRRTLSYPAYDAGRVDASAFIRWAIAEGKRADPSAALFRIDISGVGPDGFANLELATMASEHGSLDLRFSSPPKPDPSRPVGVPAREEDCEFRIEAEPDGVQLRPLSSRDCKRNVAIAPPTCTAAALWKRAAAAKAPQNAVATLGYRAWSGKARWYFDVNGEDDGKAFSKVFDDDCK